GKGGRWKPILAVAVTAETMAAPAISIVELFAGIGMSGKLADVRFHLLCRRHHRHSQNYCRREKEPHRVCSRFAHRVSSEREVKTGKQATEIKVLASHRRCAHLMAEGIFAVERKTGAAGDEWIVARAEGVYVLVAEA